MMSLRFLSSLRNLPPYLKQSSLQIHSSVVLLNSKDSSSSSSSSSDSSDSDSDKEEQRLKSFAKKPSTEGLIDADETLKTSDVNERLNNLLNKINVAAQKKALATPNEKSEIDIKLSPSFTSQDRKTKATTKLTKTKKTEVVDENNRRPTPNEKIINVAIKPKSVRYGQISKEEKLKQKPHEHQIKQAAKDVAESLGGNTQKTELELLTKALNFSQESLDTVSSSTEKKETPNDLSGLLLRMKVEKMNLQEEVQRKHTGSNQAQAEFENVSLRERVQRKYIDQQQSKFDKPSIAKSVLYAKLTKSNRYAEPGKLELNVPVKTMGIFKKISTDSKNELQLPTWNTMEKRELRLAELTVPQNVFEELIQWTNEGKIWHFPINNEQGMEDETDVHFSEHVFMERHLKGWCPRKGPIRHFMELVCTGLSKNPYMTVEEKVRHITWYKNYFEDKKEFLHELGVLDDKAPIGKKEIEA